MFTIDEIIKCTKANLLQGRPDLHIPAVSTDSRTTKKGELFLAIKGPNFNGHDFILDAESKQAGALMVSGQWAENKREVISRIKIPVIAVSDTVAALGNIARYHRLKFNIPVIGVTGSNGKTTAKDMIAAVLAAKFNVLKTEGSFNNNIGVPLSLLQLKPAHDTAVFELGMNHKGEIRSLAAEVMPNIAVITNVAPAHMEYFKSIDDIAQAKCELLEKLKDNDRAIINADCMSLYLKAKEYAAAVISFGFKDKSLYQASNVINTDDGIAFTVNNKFTFKLHALGEYNVYNALAAIAVADYFKIEFDKVRQALKSFQFPKWRMQQFDLGPIKIIADCYNANPHSMRAAITTFSGLNSNRRKILVLADMLEMGKLSRHFHRDIGELVASANIQKLVVVGENAVFSADSAAGFGMQKSNIFRCKTNKQAAGVLLEMLEPEDIVLFKGSRGMRLEQIIEELKQADLKNRQGKI